MDMSAKEENLKTLGMSTDIRMSNQKVEWLLEEDTTAIFFQHLNCHIVMS